MVACLLVGALVLERLQVHSNPFLLVVAFAALVSCAAALSLHLPRWEHVEWSVYAVRRGARGTDSRVGAVRRMLESSVDGQPASARLAEAARIELHALVGSLADACLSRRHGFTRTERPHEAAAILGPALTAYLDVRPEHPIDLATVQTLIHDLEELR